LFIGNRAEGYVIIFICDKLIFSETTLSFLTFTCSRICAER